MLSEASKRERSRSISDSFASAGDAQQACTRKAGTGFADVRDALHCMLEQGRPVAENPPV